MREQLPDDPAPVGQTEVSWREIVTAYRALVSASDSPGVSRAWEHFRELVARTADDPPYHFRGLIREIEGSRAARPRSDIAILDHGSGGGGLAFYLAALGYTNFYGVDVDDGNAERYERLNAILVQVLGVGEPRFFVCDSQTLPLADESIDVAFSQQVLEHVYPDALHAFYSEERRVLKPGGVAMHSIPHRLGPFDSHSRTWFLHWFLPTALWARVLKRAPDQAPDQVPVFLRWPWVHRRLARRYFGHVEDRTLQRLKQELTDFSYYDASASLRHLIGRLVRLPLVGRAAARMIAPFMMLDTLSYKVRPSANCVAVPREAGRLVRLITGR